MEAESGATIRRKQNVITTVVDHLGGRPSLVMLLQGRSVLIVLIADLENATAAGLKALQDMDSAAAAEHKSP